MARYRVTDLAKADIRDILAYLRERSVDAPARVRQELRDAMRNLAVFPYIGHRRDDVTPDTLRFWSVYSYLIVYRPDRNPIEIIRVLHGARDLPRELRRK
jgi:plasmid stabilization system protein ParE